MVRFKGVLETIIWIPIAMVFFIILWILVRIFGDIPE
jgi:hypothetical protein